MFKKSHNTPPNSSHEPSKDQANSALGDNDTAFPRFNAQVPDFSKPTDDEKQAQREQARENVTQRLAKNTAGAVTRREELLSKARQAIRVLLPLVLATTLTVHVAQKDNQLEENTQEAKKEQVATPTEKENNSTLLIKEKYGDKIKLQPVSGVDIKQSVQARSEPYVTDAKKDEPSNVVTWLQPQHVEANEVLILPNTRNGEMLGVSINAFPEEELAEFEDKLPENCDRLWFATGENNEYSTYQRSLDNPMLDIGNEN